MTWQAFIGVFLVLAGPFSAEAGPAAGLRILFKGLPDDTSDGELFVLMAHPDAGTMTEIRRESPEHEMTVEVPEGSLVLHATYLASSPGSCLIGLVSDTVIGDTSIEIVMKRPPYYDNPAPDTLPTYPPDEGMAIGYNPADFTIEGPSAEPGLGEALSYVVLTDLSQALDKVSGAPPFMLVESANPKGMALIAAELELQAGPEIDPESRVKPHIIAATHLVKGSFRLGTDSLVADLRVEDLEGNIIAHAAVSGPLDSLIETTAAAARALADQLGDRSTEPR